MNLEFTETVGWFMLVGCLAIGVLVLVVSWLEERTRSPMDLEGRPGPEDPADPTDPPEFSDEDPELET